MDKNSLKKMLFNIQYDGRKDIRLLKESVDRLLESKQTEQQAISILNKGGSDENENNSVLNKFKESDKSNNQILLPLMAKAYLETGDRGLNDIIVLFNSVSDLMKNNRVSMPQLTKDGYVVNNKTFPNYLKFAEFIHGVEGLTRNRVSNKMDVETDVDTEANVLFDKNKIKIYDGNDVGKCIKYTTGGLTGKRYNFCIGQPGNSNWQSYRDTKQSTFYYVVDDNRDIDNDPLHIVVVDHVLYGGSTDAYELTDENNNTGHIAEYDVKGYFDYLRKFGVPVDTIFPNKAKTPGEIADEKKLGKKNGDINFFMGLEKDEKSRYIGRGHLLSDKQFNYIWQFKNIGEGENLLKQYVDTGQAIPEEQFNVLVSE